MKHVLIVAPCREWEKEAAFRIRLGALAEAMRRRGYTWDIRARPRGPLGRWKLARAARGCHAVVLHRKWLDGYEARAYRRNLPAGGKIIMDIDDATMYHETELGGVARRRLERRVAATMKVLDRACAGNEYLAEIFRKEGVAARVVPSVVEPQAYPVKVHTETTTPRLVPWPPL